MNTSLMPAIVAGALAIVTVIGTNHFTRKRDRAAEGLVASAHVLLASAIFPAGISIENKNRDLARHDHLRTLLVRAMRADISPPSLIGEEALEFRSNVPPPGKTTPTSPNSRTST